MGNLVIARDGERMPRRRQPSINGSGHFIMSNRRVQRRPVPYSARQGVISDGTALLRHLAMYDRLKYVGSVEYEKTVVVREDLADRGPGNSAVFNVEFSPQGNYVVALMESGHVLLVDPLTRQLSHRFSAHDDCVNFACFIDNNTFATCSDDCSVKVWDARWLRRSPTPMWSQDRAHNNWVKNVHFDKASGYILSSGFDKMVNLWDLNATEWDEEKSGVCMAYLNNESNLMRSALSPDGCTLCLARHPITFALVGKCWVDVFHDIKLKEQGLDFEGCSKKRITTWPAGCSFILSLQIFPNNEHLLSRCTSGHGGSEFLCVHSLSHYALLYVIDESNNPPGIIKEPGLSHDCRVICSPFGSRVRIMGFDMHLPQPVLAFPRDCPTGDLYEVCDVITPFRDAPVLTSRFSPTQMLVACGTADGDVCFAEPRFS